MEDELQYLPLCHQTQCIGCDQTELQRLGSKFGFVNAVSIVRDLNDDLVALVIGIQSNGATCGFPVCYTVLWEFDPMVNCITYKMCERFGQHIQYALIK